MILKMIYETELSKQDRKKFIPFVNERNHMGEIIKNKQKDRQHMKSIDVFENLKKTTKEYFFDKKYQKMKQKLSRCKLSMEAKQPNYDRQVRRCFKSLQKSSLVKNKSSTTNRFIDNDTFFVDLNERLNENIETLKSQIQKNYKNKILKPQKMSPKNKTFHGDSLKIRRTCGELSRKSSDKENDYNECRNTTITTPKRDEYFGKERMITSVNREIFRDLSKQSEKMVDFTNFGMKYRHMVEAEKKDPWKKWYVDYRVEIFPGEVIKLKKLQKSIYG